MELIQISVQKYHQDFYTLAAFPANLQNWSSTFQALVSAGTIQGGSIVVQAF